MASTMKFYGDRVMRKFESDAPGIIHRIAEIIAEKAKQIVTVKSGKLKNSISADDNTVIAETDYAAAVELGTAKRAAKPFFRPAIKQFDKADLEQSLR